jgi:hypothetical protein
MMLSAIAAFGCKLSKRRTASKETPGLEELPKHYQGKVESSKAKKVSGVPRRLSL